MIPCSLEVNPSAYCRGVINFGFSVFLCLEVLPAEAATEPLRRVAVSPAETKAALPILGDDGELKGSLGFTISLVFLRASVRGRLTTGDRLVFVEWPDTLSLGPSMASETS